MYSVLFLFTLLVFIAVYNHAFKKPIFKNELKVIRKKEALLKENQRTATTPKETCFPSDVALINYLNKIIDDSKVEIVKKYFSSFYVTPFMHQLLFSTILFFSLSSCSQEKLDLKKDAFLGHWASSNSLYFLSINHLQDGYKFTSYKFTAYEDDTGTIAWDRFPSPGKEVFVKKEDNVIVTNYWIDEHEYYVKVYYTLIDDNNMKAEFNGKLKGELYYNTINYKRKNLKDAPALIPMGESSCDKK